MGYPHCRGWANRRWGTGADCNTAVRPIPRSRFQLLWNRCLSVCLSCSFFFSQSCDVALIFMLCCSPQSTENSKQSLSSWQALHLQQQHLCSESRLFVYPSIRAKIFPTNSSLCLFPQPQTHAQRVFPQVSFLVGQSSSDSAVDVILLSNEGNMFWTQLRPPSSKLNSTKPKMQSATGQVQWTFHRLAQFNTLMHSVQRKASAYSEIHEHTHINARQIYSSYLNKHNNCLVLIKWDIWGDRAEVFWTCVTLIRVKSRFLMKQLLTLTINIKVQEDSSSFKDVRVQELLILVLFTVKTNEDGQAFSCKYKEQSFHIFLNYLWVRASQQITMGHNADLKNSYK